MRAALLVLCAFLVTCCRGTIGGLPDGTADADASLAEEADGSFADDGNVSADEGAPTDSEPSGEDGGPDSDDGASGDDNASDGDGGLPGEIIPPERRIIWESNVGIPGGIPNRTVCCANLEASAYGNGSADATSAIQNVLDSCNQDQVVCLSAGVFKITSTVFLRDHIVLRGSGPQSTTISYQGPAGGRSAIAFTNWPNFDSARHVAVTSAAIKGSTRITVEDASGVVAGDVMLIDQLNDGELVDPEGVEGKCTYCGRADGDRTLGQLVEVTAVNGTETKSVSTFLFIGATIRGFRPRPPSSLPGA